MSVRPSVRPWAHVPMNHGHSAHGPCSHGPCAHRLMGTVPMGYLLIGPWAMCSYSHGPSAHGSLAHGRMGPWAMGPWAHWPMVTHVSAYLQMRESTCPTFCPDPRVSADLHMRESKFSFRQLSLGELSFPSFFVLKRCKQPQHKQQQEAET